jgi:protein phosphatase
MKIQSSGCSDVGKVRENNEDSYLIEEEHGLYLVADGMGGHLGGKTASTMAVNTIREAVQEQYSELVDQARAEPVESSMLPRLLADAIRKACATIFERAAGDPELRGMGTTVTAMMVLEGRAFVAHVGDSRCYLYRDQGVTQVTDDHSLVNEQIKAGILTEEQAAESHLKNIITRSVGFERDVSVDTLILSLQEGDRFLLCSDGLSNLVNDAEIGEALGSMALESVPESMVQLANDRGGDDNITVVCLSVEPQ